MTQRTGACFKIPGHRGYTPSLVETAEYDNLDGVKLLLAASNDVNERDEYGRTALMMAFEEGRHRRQTTKEAIEIAKLLIANGADVNAGDDYGTVLMRAARSGHLDVVKAMLAKGADPKRKDKFGRTAWGCAAH